MSLAKKATLNASSGLLFFIIKIIITLIMNPLLIQYLGSVHFGIWKAIENFLGFASIADGKAIQALKWTIANQESSNDFNRKKRAISSALIIWFIFLPILSIVVGLLVYFSPELIKNLNTEDYSLVTLILLVLGLNLILTPLFGISESVLIGTNQGWVANYNHIIWSIISAILMYIVLILGYGLKYIAFIILLITILRGLNLLFLCKGKVQWFGLLKPKSIEVLSFSKFSSWVLSWSFVSRFLLASEVLLFGIFVGAESISKYAFTSYVAATGISLAAIITSSMTPGLGKLIGNEEFTRSFYVITKLRELSFSFSIFFAVSILLLNKSFVFLWAGSELFLGWTNNVLIVLLMVQLIYIRNEAFLIDLSLNLRRKVLLGVISVTLSIICAVIGYQYINHDISSILIGIILGRLFLVIMFPTMVNKMLKEKRKVLSIKNLLVTTFLICMGAYIGSFQLLSTWIEFFFVGTGEIFLCIFYIYAFLLNEENKKIISSKIVYIYEKKIKKS